MTEMPSEGGFFSRNYLRKETPTADDERMRHRLAVYIDDYSGDDDYKIGRLIERELGLQVLQSGYERSYIPWKDIFSSFPIGDLLDIITLICRIWPTRRVGSYREEYNTSLRDFAERVFREQGVAYRIDAKGGIHPFVDITFSSSYMELVDGLGREGFQAARESIEAAEKALLAVRFNGRLAVRSTFDAVENIYKVTFPGRTHLNKDGFRNDIKPLLESHFSSSDVERRATGKLADGLNSWIEAGHFFRHDPGQPEPAAPSQDFAIHYVSTGISIARWLLKAVSGNNS